MNIWVSGTNIFTLGTEEDTKAQIKDLENLFSEIIIGNSPNLEAMLDIQLQEAFRIPSRLAQKFTSN